MERLNLIWNNVNLKYLMQSKRFGVFLIALILIAYNGQITQEETNQALEIAKILLGSYAVTDGIKVLPFSFGKKTEKAA